MLLADAWVATMLQDLEGNLKTHFQSFLPAADISLKFYLSCPSQAVTLSACVFYKPNPPCSSVAHGEHWPVDSEQCCFLDVAMLFFILEHFQALRATCMAKVLCSRPPPSKRQTFDVNLFPCMHLLKEHQNGAVVNPLSFRRFVCGPGRKKMMADSKAEMANLWQISHAWQDFPFSCVYVGGNFLQVGWNDGVLVVSKTQLFRETQDASSLS